MPYSDGTYSQADISKKLMGAAVSLNKRSNPQAAVYLLHDALGMIEKVSGIKLAEQDRSLSGVGMPQGEFRKAVIGEKIGLAIMKIGRQEWSDAGASIWSALVLIQRLALEKQQRIIMTASPPESEGEPCLKTECTTEESWNK